MGKNKSKMRTDQDGKAELALGNEPVQILVCIHEEPADGDVDYQQYMAFLAFMHP
jgi:hypothetical protein